MDYRDWGYDTRGPRERRSGADAYPPASWEYTGEIYGAQTDRRTGAHRADDEGDPSGSVYRGRRRQQDDSVADDRPYGRRSTRARWRDPDDATGTWSRYVDPGDSADADGWRADAPTSGWTADAPTSGWTPDAPTSGWTGAAHTSEWTREAYTGEWRRDAQSAEWTREAHTGEWRRDDADWSPPRPAGGSTRAGRRRAEPDDTGVRGGTDWRELADWREPSDEPASRRAALPALPARPAPPAIPRQDRSSRVEPPTSVTDTSEWVAPRDPLPADGTPERLSQRPDWAVGRDPAPAGRRRRSWQDQIEPRWPDSRDDDDPRRSGGRTDDAEPRWSGRRDDDTDAPWSRDRDDDTGAPWSDDDDRDDDATRWPSRRGKDVAARWSGGRTDEDARARLADDDPRWVGIPSSAPRSPAVAYPDERRDYGERSRSFRTEPPGRGAVSSRQRAAAPSLRQPASAPPLRQRASAPSLRRGVDEIDDDFVEAPPGGVRAAILATLAWYAVPLLLFGTYTLTQGSGAQAQALISLSDGAARVGVALGISLVVAVALRWVSTNWRSVSVGLAAAVVGGGLSTVLFSAISGQPLG